MRPRTPFRSIDVREAERLIARNDVLVLDVRDAASFDRARVDGAQNVSGANLSAVIGATAKTKPVLIYCYHGHASREYAQIFSDFGFAEVRSLDGGFEAWTQRSAAAGAAPADEPLRQWLADEGFPQRDIHAVISNGTTPLMKASHQGQGGIVRKLIAAGAPLDARNADGNNALWLACVGGHLEVIDMLVDAGIDIDNRNDNGATPLMYAASSGKADVIERLLAHRADVTPETLDGFSALDLAATVECLRLLRRASSEAQTPIRLAETPRR
jgi:thiosulfate/3-mercaptopyruvate sulfurtransferase